MSTATDIRGLLMVGVTNTVLFEGGEVTELLFFNLENGQEVSLPVTEEQAHHILSFVPEVEPIAPEEVIPSNGETKNNAVVNMVTAMNNGTQSPDTTPQL